MHVPQFRVAFKATGEAAIDGVNETIDSMGNTAVVLCYDMRKAGTWED